MLLHHFPYILIDLYFAIPEVIMEMFILTAELVIPTGTQINEANAGIETQRVTAESKISKFSTQFKYVSSYTLYSLNNFLSSKKYYFVSSIFVNLN